jgi:dipeptidyl aminopeptidase/acylaminoacyl peptidase
MRVATLLLLAGGLVAALPSNAFPQEGAPRPIAIDDQFALRGLGSPVLSPEGDWVAYTVSTTDAEEESSATRLWMTRTDGTGAPLAMTREGESVGSPAWSPDGRYLSFTASRGEDARTQVWVLDRRGGEAWALTDVEQGVSDYVWSPEGTRLALVMRDPEVQDSTWTSDRQKPWVIDRLQFKRDRAGYLTDTRHSHLYVFDVESREVRQLTAGGHDESGPVWSPDGTRIAFTSNRTEDPDTNSNTDIWVVSVDVEEPVTEPLRITSNPGSDSSPAWSPDGGRIAYTTVIRPDLIWYATTHLAVVNADGTGAQVLTEAMDRNVSSPVFSPDGRLVYFGVEDSAENQVGAYDLDTDRTRRVTSGPMSVRGMDVNRRGQMVARIARTDLPGDIFRLDGVTGAATGRAEAATFHRLTAVNDDILSRLALGEVREERWESEPGVEVEGFVHLPPDYEPGRRYPLLLRPHGGPVSQYSHSFNFEAHLFAANGYVVLTPNPRGSSGYGEEFSAVLWADWGNPDFRDVMAGVDHLIEQGIADGDRMGVGGWSYGGILTNYVITQTDRFKGAITGASEVLYISNYGHDHYQLQWEAELGLPWEGNNRENWERISPFNKVQDVTTPTLIMGGEKDWNVPILNSEQLYQALRRRGIPTQLVVYPGQPHGIGPVSYRRDRHERYLEWYERWVKGADRTPVS